MACLIISGPSGAGKTTLLNRLKKEFDFYFSISSTTRAKRDGEIDGVHYHFVSKEDFQNGIESGQFLEYAVVHGNYYGTSLLPIQKAFDDGKSVVFDIDVQGYRIAREKLKGDYVSVFIMPVSLTELESRLKSRNSNDSNISTRLKNAIDEVSCICEYDFVIINDDLETAYEELKQIFITTELKKLTKIKKEIILSWNKGD